MVDLGLGYLAHALAELLYVTAWTVEVVAVVWEAAEDVAVAWEAAEDVAVAELLAAFFQAPAIPGQVGDLDPAAAGVGDLHAEGADAAAQAARPTFLLPPSSPF